MQGVAKVHREIIEILVETEGVETLAEFGAYVTKSKYEEEAVTLSGQGGSFEGEAG